MTSKETYGPLYDIQYLRAAAQSYGSKPHWFGLGFIQLKLNDRERVHFWCPEIPHPEREEIHDHRYNFTSTVLAGMLHFELYEYKSVMYSPIAPHELFQTDCAPGHEGNKDPKVYGVSIQHRGTYDLAAGSQYWFSENQFHTTEGTEYAITHLLREPKTKQYANVIKVKGAPTTCPFAETMSEEKLWDHIMIALTKAWPYKDRIY